MNFNQNQLNTLKAESILDFLLPTINSFYKKYNYIGIPIDEYKILVLEEIERTKKEYHGKESYEKFITNRINNMLSTKVKKMIQNPETSFLILDKYINKNFSDTTTAEESLQNFQQLNDFIENYKYKYNPNIIIELVNKNFVFTKMVDLILKQYKEQITKLSIEKLFDNNLLLLTLDVYSMLNEMENPNNQNLEQIDQGTQITTMDSVKIYYEEASRYPLLTSEQEKDLAEKIKKGDKEAKNTFIQSNLRLVINIATKYIDRGLPLLDLIQEGNIGLMKAVDRYDGSKGYKFSTYAIWWIRQAIRSAIVEKGRSIRIPGHIYSRLGSYKRVKEQLEEKYNREPTVEEIATAMNLSIQQVENIRIIEAPTTSLNNIVGESKDIELLELIPDEKSTIEDKVFPKFLQYQVRQLLETSQLKPKEKEILILRFGLDNGFAKTLEEIGKKFGVSRECIRQKEKRSLEKLRKFIQFGNLVEYMDKPEETLKKVKKSRHQK